MKSTYQLVSILGLLITPPVLADVMCNGTMTSGYYCFDLNNPGSISTVDPNGTGYTIHQYGDDQRESRSYTPYGPNVDRKATPLQNFFKGYYGK